ncbi:MAG: glycoside hydrolase family 88 protein [Rhodocyclales bacterium]|nr:glycoside hydrolase family 88 protein [Rhodocyclales bacterium]
MKWHSDFYRRFVMCLSNYSVIAPSGGHAAAFDEAMTADAIVRVMTAVADWQLAHPSRFPTYGWHVAPFWAGLLGFAPLSQHTQKYVDAVRANGAGNNWKPAPRPFHADDIAIAQSYFLLYEREPNPAYIAPSLAYLDRMLANPYDETLEFSLAQMEREWIWCDALFMAPPALLLAARITGDIRYTTLMERLWWKTSDHLYDKQEQLFYRDGRFLDKREANGTKVFWSRGNGWVLAGLARVLEYLPADAPQRTRLTAQYRDMAQRIGGLQSADGYWRASLLDPASTPAPESSGTGFFTYALAWGVNNGILDRHTYASVIQKGWSALVRAVQPDGMLGYVQQVGYQPGDTGPEQTEAYGPGALLLAGTEVYRLAGK